MKARHKRMMFIVLGLVAVTAIAALILNALQSNINHFFSPTEVVANEAPKDRTFRLGGLVEVDSVKREDDGLTVHFNVTDNAEVVTVKYTGILPDLFSEGQGVVAQGKLSTAGIFEAEEVLAKHDETYMPPEVADALEKAEEAAEQGVAK
ncbi:MAG TPA: cytochrome c maturation protein CcmE [Candidatus Tenderia electrophaga]|uniref:Cytochrome c-type biogenesis protein CcmE n=1 Tax=Candidatus Tenderia electrophaga TaxID=1748243 RepID=A0A832N3F7_9GAMM|nr:cytochrome c maturation protein CcmE [Candidatus Tenderia electrophaga]